MAKADMQPLREQKLEGGAFGGATPLNIAAAAARWASLNRKVGPRDRRGSYFIFVHEASRIESTRYLLALLCCFLWHPRRSGAQLAEERQSEIAANTNQQFAAPQAGGGGAASRSSKPRSTEVRGLRRFTFPLV